MLICFFILNFSRDIFLSWTNTELCQRPSLQPLRRSCGFCPWVYEYAVLLYWFKYLYCPWKEGHLIREWSLGFENFYIHVLRGIILEFYYCCLSEGQCWLSRVSLVSLLPVSCLIEQFEGRCFLWRSRGIQCDSVCGCAFFS